MATPIREELASSTPKVTALVGLNAQGVAVLAATTAVGAGIGLAVAQRKLLGAFIGGGLGFGLPIAATLLIVLPLKQLTLADKETSI